MLSIFRKGLKVLREEGLKIFTKKFLLWIYKGMKFIILSCLGYVLVPVIIREFKSRAEQIHDIEDAVDFSFRFRYLGVSIAPIQIKWEITRLLKLIAGIKPKVVLEIGTAAGGSLFLFTMVADLQATIISVDLPRGYLMWKGLLYKSFAKGRQRIHLIRADSHNPITLKKVRSILAGRKIDFLFIDGDHTYRGVKKDFEMYSPLVRKGGIIAFHDIVSGPPKNVGGVPIFWNEIKHKYKHLEIVKSYNQGWAGIGIIYV